MGLHYFFFYFILYIKKSNYFIFFSFCLHKLRITAQFILISHILAKENEKLHLQKGFLFYFLCECVCV